MKRRYSQPIFRVVAKKTILFFLIPLIMVLLAIDSYSTPVLLYTNQNGSGGGLHPLDDPFYAATFFIHPNGPGIPINQMLIGTTLSIGVTGTYLFDANNSPNFETLESLLTTPQPNLGITAKDFWNSTGSRYWGGSGLPSFFGCEIDFIKLIVNDSSAWVSIDPSDGLPTSYASADDTWEFWGSGQFPSFLPVPEPSTMLLLGFGLIGLWGARKKFKK